MTAFRTFHLAFVLLALALTGSASADQVFTFTQQGFSGGGEIIGRFTAVDLDHDGQILAAPWGASLATTEVTSFVVSFTGDSIIPDFTLSDLGAFCYDLNAGPYLGDGTTGLGEGIINNWLDGSNLLYVAGIGPGWGPGGAVFNLADGSVSSTTEWVVVTPVADAVPDSPSYVYTALLALLCVALVLVRRSMATNLAAA